MTNNADDKFELLLTGQKKLETQYDQLSTKVDHLATDVDKLKTDVAELKEGQNRTERFLLNLENLIVPKINAMYESAIRFDKHAEEAQETKRIHTEKLENHELRIIRLEHEARP